MKLEVGQYFYKKDEKQLLAKIIKIKSSFVVIIDPLATDSYRYQRSYYWDNESFLKNWKYIPAYNTPLWKVLND